MPQPKGEILVPLDESDFLAHCERQEQEIRKLKATLAEKDLQLKTLDLQWKHTNEHYEEQIAALIAKRDKGFELAMTESAPDYERVPRLYSLVHHLQAEIEKLKLEMNRMVRY